MVHPNRGVPTKAVSVSYAPAHLSCSPPGGCLGFELLNYCRLAKLNAPSFPSSAASRSVTATLLYRAPARHPSMEQSRHRQDLAD